ncbi:unnamed protein product [Amoebophrya sp. A25]|nr:unnamed protein product [Amoebophrya sp. A25]|eukprot:GSA25T00027503001.1
MEMVEPVQNHEITTTTRKCLLRVLPCTTMQEEVLWAAISCRKNENCCISNKRQDPVVTDIVRMKFAILGQRATWRRMMLHVLMW